MPPENANRRPFWWEPVWELVVHIIVGSLLFAIIFAPAVALDFLVQWLRNALNVSEFLAVLLTGTKIAIAVLDVTLYLTFMLRMAWLFLVKIWSPETNEEPK
ncbi:MAG: hypothetical protein HYX68_10595 [Planctomycetes bacterium]|nr:hypothetical protein [Planctomycetota bacterium]